MFISKKFSASLLALVMLTGLLAGCGAKSPKASEGLEFSSNGDGTCTWTGVGSCEDNEIFVPEKNGDETVTAVAKNTLGSDSKVTKVTLPGSVASIQAGAFMNAKTLEEVTLNKGLKVIEEDAFRGCEKLQSITFPEGLESIGDWAFFQCTALTEIILPEGLTELGDFAFNYCSNVKKIHIPSTLNAVKFAGPEGTDADRGGQFDTVNLEEFSYAGNWGYYRINVGYRDGDTVFKPYYYGELVRDAEKMEYPNQYASLTEANTQSIICALLNKQSITVNGESWAMTTQKPVGTYIVEDKYGYVKAAFTEDGTVSLNYMTYSVDETVVSGTYTYDETANTYHFEGTGSYDGQSVSIVKDFVFFEDTMYCHDVIDVDGSKTENMWFWVVDNK